MMVENTVWQGVRVGGQKNTVLKICFWARNKKIRLWVLKTAECKALGAKIGEDSTSSGVPCKSGIWTRSSWPSL